MTDRDYLWCALHLVLDEEEELARLCPSCRAEAERERCLVCGAAQDAWGSSGSFDMARYEVLKGETG